MTDDRIAELTASLTAQAATLHPVLSRFARDVYEVRWAIEDGKQARKMSDEVCEKWDGVLGIVALEDAVNALAAELCAAGDGALPAEMPEWFETARNARRARYRGGIR